MIVEVNVPKETYELAQALKNIVKAAKDAVADGWQPGQDLPIIFTAALAELPKAIGGIDQMPAEFKADPMAFSKAFALTGFDIADLFIKK